MRNEKMKRAVTILGLLVFLCAGSLFAQTISLEEARVLALANSRSLAKYDLSIKGSLLDERNQLYSMLPKISAGYNASMTYLNRDFGIENPADTFKAGASFSVTQKIFEGGKNLIQKSLSSISTEGVRNEALAEYYNVLDSADNAYYAVLEAAATLEAAESALQSSISGLNIAEIRQSSGMISQGDYLKALADRESRENNRNQARRNLALSQSKFKSLLGVSATLEPEPVDFSGYMELIARLGSISDEDADSLYRRFRSLLLSVNPALVRAGLNNTRAEKNLSLARRDYAPTISATLFADTLNYTIADGFSNAASGGVSITGSIPLDFWVLSNRVEKSRIALNSARLDYAGAEIQLDTELQSALINAFTQAGSVLSSGRSLEYTQKNFEYVEERYRLSQSSVSDLQDASSSLITSRNNLINSRFGFLQSLSRLRSLAVMDDEEKLIAFLMGR